MDLTPNEQQFISILGAAVRGETAMPAPDTDWSSLLTLASQHQVLPMVASALPRQVVAMIPSLRMEVFRQVSMQITSSKAFAALYTAMEEAGFHPLVVKGIVCRNIYPGGEMRPSGDEDLYVTDEEFAPVCEFLRSYGMVPGEDDRPDAYEIPWEKPGSPLYIELHRRLFAPDSGAYGELERFFDISRSRFEYKTEYGTVHSLTPHDHMLYLLLHAYKHFIHSGFGIRQICDIGLWAQRYGDQIDWDRLAEQCDSCSARQFAAAVLGIAVHAIGISVNLLQQWQTDADFCQPMLEDILAGGVYGKSDTERLHSSTVTLNAVEADRSGGRTSIWQSVFLKRSEMEKKYPYLRRFPFLLPVAWIQRIFHYLIHRNGGSDLTASVTIGAERVKLLKMYGIIR